VNDFVVKILSVSAGGRRVRSRDMTEDSLEMEVAEEGVSTRRIRRRKAD
jgi:hypothetical protein